ncbi:beta-lactamase superfamily domain-containing protein [Alternaria rosae]|uniref:beta-lactamase superfamily domain-containing protein n=1 Tax=Alternaria rosae TaxID=1187941 RepID=UPI001E8D0956|nr:beta-lactamase superfamily domain-containing protein [Alternaria rosae]KAH6872822.1 beta-lactamase superfamily domain-containing protein [Alternaria rosae]
MSRLPLLSRIIRKLFSESRNYHILGKLQPRWQTPHFARTLKMSSIGGASIGVGLYAVVSNPVQIAAKPEEADEKRHHLKNGKGFTNPWDSYVESSPWELLIKGMLWRKITGQANSPDTSPPTIPVHKPTFLPSRETPRLRATWLGHACYHVEFPSGFRVLFDPVFEDCCAPFTIKSLKRYTPPPCEIEDLPIVDAVVISHNHYDHLSYPTIQRLKKKFPEAHFFAPLGNKEWFEKSGVTKVTELDWWESRDVKLEELSQKGGRVGSVSVSSVDAGKNSGITATIGALPCQHISARTPFDKAKTLWASWSVESGGAKVYFAGDTGYRTVPSSIPATEDDYSAAYSHLPTCPAFSQIGQHRGPFDLGLIPIGAYEPRWMFSNVHASPKDAVNIFADTKCKRALGMHWGTWVLTEEEVMAPPKELQEACEWKGIKAGKEGFGVCDIGESTEFESGQATRK